MKGNDRLFPNDTEPVILVWVSLIGLLSLASEIRVLSADDQLHVRTNQVGHQPKDAKVAVASSTVRFKGSFDSWRRSLARSSFQMTSHPHLHQGGKLFGITIDSTSAHCR